MKFKKLFYAVVVIFMAASCKKNEIISEPLASLNVVAAVISGGNVKLNTNERDSAKNYSWKIFGIVPSKSITLYPTNNPTVSYFQNLKPATQEGGLYSVFLCGHATAPEEVFIEETVPDFYIDSVIGVRIINLSPNSAPINITLASDVSTNVFSNVAYKHLTNIKTIPLPNVVSNNAVTFQIRNAAGAVLTSYQLPASVNSSYPGISRNLQRFKNITLVIKGLEGTSTGVDAFGVFPVAMTY